MSQASPLFFERYELKFLINLEIKHDIIKYIESFCEYDPFSKNSENNSYIVNSLYLDTFNDLFYSNKSAGIGERFNMRIRSYGQDPRPPFFLEVKCKKNGFIKKYRSPVQLENLNRFFSNTCNSEIQDRNLSIFLRLMTSYGAEPKVLTRYHRTALFSTLDDYGRITFDENLQYQEENELNVKPSEDMMKNYDSENIFSRDRDVVLELKCHNNVPIWMIDLIKYFSLERTGFSKFYNSRRALMSNQGIENSNDFTSH